MSIEDNVGSSFTPGYDNSGRHEIYFLSGRGDDFPEWVPREVPDNAKKLIDKIKDENTWYEAVIQDPVLQKGWRIIYKLNKDREVVDIKATCMS